jgi:aspartyl-tRNA synthetase
MRRVSCPEHGVVVAAVPWARPGSRFTAACELSGESVWSFLWVVDALLFDSTEGAGDVAVGFSRWTARHHRCTAPRPEWIDRFEEDPASALATPMMWSVTVTRSAVV